jgi:putative redox protein
MGSVSVKWVDSKLMVGVDSHGHPLVISTWPERDPQWSGLKPSDLLLLAAASCSMYDVLEILKKQRIYLKDLEVICFGEQLREPPYRFVKVHLSYIAQGNVLPEKLEKAIKLSQEKYCSVIATIRPGVDLTSEYKIIEE